MKENQAENAQNAIFFLNLLLYFVLFVNSDNKHVLACNNCIEQ